MDVSIYRLRLQDLLGLCVLSLLLLGVLMVESASTAVAGEGGMWGFTTRGWKHLITAVLGACVFLLLAHVDYRRLFPSGTRWWMSPLVWLYALAVTLCAATLIPGVGTAVKGARRWLDVGPFQLQPSEVAKWTVVLLTVYLVTRVRAVRERFAGFLLACAVIAMPCVLVVLQDFGTAALIGAVAMLILVAGGVKWWYPLVLLPPMVLAAVVAVAAKPYRLRRVTSFLSPMDDPQGEGYHMVQSLLSFSSGGVFGKGLGNGVQKLGYLPEVENDFIFALISEELGLFGALLVMVLFLGIAWVGWQLIRDAGAGRGDDASAQSRDDAASVAGVLAFGVVMMVCVQAWINMAVATVSVPTKGLPLPLVSAGGTGLVMTAAALGVLASAVRQRERATAARSDAVEARGSDAARGSAAEAA